MVESSDTFVTTLLTTSCTTNRTLHSHPHTGVPPLTHSSLPSYYKELKKYHLQHHFSDYQKGFGVTSKFWDKVFGTELMYGPNGKSEKEQ